ERPGQIEKELPQPQDEAAFGLRIWNEAPIKSSTKSSSAPFNRSSEVSSTTTPMPSRSNRTSSGFCWSSKLSPYWKPEQPPPETGFPDGDYVSPGLAVIRLDAAFPNMVVGDKTSATWPYIRREVPHNWYVDRRQPSVGFVSRDEAHILYNSALRCRGRQLEIG